MPAEIVVWTPMIPKPRSRIAYDEIRVASYGEVRFSRDLYVKLGSPVRLRLEARENAIRFQAAQDDDPLGFKVQKDHIYAYKLQGRKITEVVKLNGKSECWKWREEDGWIVAERFST